MTLLLSFKETLRPKGFILMGKSYDYANSFLVQLSATLLTIAEIIVPFIMTNLLIYSANLWEIRISLLQAVNKDGSLLFVLETEMQ